METSAYKFDLPKRNKSIIKVIGVGGGGSNAVNHMFRQGIKDVEFVVANTDVQALNSSPVPIKLQLGVTLTEGLGCGANPKVGRAAAIESKEQIRDMLEGAKMVFITAGMGGGTGTGAAPVIAKIAGEMDILTVGIVTMPFGWEGKKKYAHAQQGIDGLRSACDTVLVILNDQVRAMFGNLSISQAFGEADNVLTTAAKGIAEIITLSGYVNVDFQDVRTVMRNAGAAVMGSGQTSGQDRAIRAAQAALNSPLLDNRDIMGAKKILLSIISGQEAELQMDELTMITEYIQGQAGDECEVIFGHGLDDSLGGNIRVTVIATGFATEDKPRPKKEEKKVMDLETPLAETKALLDNTVNQRNHDVELKMSPNPLAPEGGMDGQEEHEERDEPIFGKVELAKLEEAAKLAELVKMEEAAKLAELVKMEEAAKLAELVKMEEAAKLAESIKMEEAAKLAELVKMEEAAKLAELVKMEEAAKLAELVRMEEATKLAEVVRMEEAAKLAELVKMEEAAKLVEEIKAVEEEKKESFFEKIEEPVFEKEVEVKMEMVSDFVEKEEVEEEPKVQQSSIREISFGEVFNKPDEKKISEIPFEINYNKPEEKKLPAIPFEVRYAKPEEELPVKKTKPSPTQETYRYDLFSDMETPPIPKFHEDDFKDDLGDDGLFNEDDDYNVGDKQSSDQVIDEDGMMKHRSTKERLEQQAKERRDKFKASRKQEMSKEEFNEKWQKAAFTRRGVRLENVPHSSEGHISRYNLNDDNNLLGNNKFLHDNVD
jgi:cell division protein FtsZ